MTNARKYSEATQVDVILDFSAESKLTIRVDDNGKGTDKTDGGFGLLGIRERIGLLGGTLNLETAPDDGFRITATVPG